jgi:ribonuclease HII
MAGRSPARRAPTRAVEKELWAEGYDVNGHLSAAAGPLMVGAAIRKHAGHGVRIKLLSEANREALFDRIAEWCEAWAVGGASQQECDEMGMAAHYRRRRWRQCPRGR